jgi:hypothetical protein
MNVQQTLANYEKWLKDVQSQHEAMVAEANAKLTALTTSAQVASTPKKPQSAWITGSDGDRFMILNEDAVEQMNKVFEGIKEVVAMLAAKERPVGKK